MSKEKIIDGVKESILTDVEWNETERPFLSSAFKNRPPASCPVIHDLDREEFRVYSKL